ncbi:hypothetical protein FNT36_14735 [Hymenobacter setariae]|uniref:DUF5117 domain-containing protein n=1 Tax=Hymenobacter setariae TaxID=2594794 RepID=A0A558BW82_9BACT|nr:hypothetical protein [Hymenobacter setariae]TVT40713.1 hypothetical protein FNT36_14735 [Hymenobacter setariae]
MKALFIAVLSLTCVSQACQQQSAEKAASQAPSRESNTAEVPVAAPTLAQRLSPVLNDYWVSADYLREVARTRSPQAAFDGALSPTSLVIEDFAGQKDSVEIGASYGLHEGGSLTLLLQAGTQPGSLRVREPYGGEAGTRNELAYRITSTDTTLLYITRKSSTNKIISQLAYRRTGMPGKTSDLEAGVELGINKLLLAGSYTGTDSTRRAVAVRFFTDGTVLGLPFKKYVIQTDFTGPTPGDELVFDGYTKQQQSFAASFGRDTLKLYTMRSLIGIPPGGTDTTEYFIRGRLRYQLIRTKQL